MEHYGDIGEGAYMKSNIVNQMAASSLRHRLGEILDDIEIPSHGAFVLCDYGCADGGTSLDLISAAIEMLREKQPDLQIQVVYEDQAAADYISLFRLLNGELGKQSYREKYSDVYVSAVGVSYFNQCLPNQTLHLGIAVNSMMFLSKIPCRLTNSVSEYNPDCVPEEHELYQQQGVNDFTTILLQRAKEMHKGGCLVVASPHPCPGERWPQFVAEQLWHEYANDGRITQDEFHNSNFQLAILPKAHIVSLFARGTALALAGLQLLSVHEQQNHCVFTEQLISNGGYACQEAVRRYARDLTQCYKTYVYSSYYNGLSSSRTPQERKRITENMFADAEDIVAENPEKYNMSRETTIFVIKKEM